MKNFDANASYGLTTDVIEAIRDVDLQFCNASAVHRLGQLCRAVIESARAKVSRYLRLPKGYRIVFNSGATEGNTQAIFYPLWKAIANQEIATTELITATTEHLSVLENFKKAEDLGFKVHYISPDSEGRIAVEDVLAKVNNQTALVSIMAANNETGIFNDVHQLFSEIRKANPKTILHCDTTQVLGKSIFDFATLDFDFINFSAHKIGALPGTGALVVKDSLDKETLLAGGPQESRWRPGTENLLGIHAFGKACEVLSNLDNSHIENVQMCKHELVKILKEETPNVIFNFENTPALANTLSIQCPEMLADDLVVALDLEGIAIASGSACASGKPLPSHVLLASGMTAEQARSTVRVSMRMDVQMSDIEFFARKFIPIIKNG